MYTVKYDVKNTMLHNKQIYVHSMYIHSCDNTLKFKKNEKVCIIK